MTYTFEIEMVKWHHNRGTFIFVKHLGNEHTFSIPDGSLLEDLPIEHYKEMYPIKDESGLPLYDIFVFRYWPVTRLDETRFAEGKIVKLIVQEK